MSTKHMMKALLLCIVSISLAEIPYSFSFEQLKLKRNRTVNEIRLIQDQIAETHVNIVKAEEHHNVQEYNQLIELLEMQRLKLQNSELDLTEVDREMERLQPKGSGLPVTMNRKRYNR